MHLQDLHLEALRSTELSGGLGRPGSSEDLSSPPSLGSVDKSGSGINPELVDLTCMLTPGSSSSPEGQREEVLVFLHAWSYTAGMKLHCMLEATLHA